MTNIINIINEEIQTILNENINNLFYRGISTDEAIKSAKSGHLVYKSKDPMSRDWEVIEYSLGDEANNISDEGIENYIEALVDWKPNDQGINLTTDLDNAKGYSPIVVSVDIIGDFAQFSDAHIFAKNPEDCVVKEFYVENQKEMKWDKYTPQEFLKNIHKYY